MTFTEFDSRQFLSAARLQWHHCGLLGLFIAWQWGALMRYRKSPSLVPSAGVLVRSCPICDGQMFLRRIDPDKPDYDRRTFECAMCDHIEITVVKYR